MILVLPEPLELVGILAGALIVAVLVWAVSSALAFFSMDTFLGGFLARAAMPLAIASYVLTVVLLAASANPPR